MEEWQSKTDEVVVADAPIESLRFNYEPKVSEAHYEFYAIAGDKPLLVVKTILTVLLHTFFLDKKVCKKYLELRKITVFGGSVAIKQAGKFITV